MEDSVRANRDYVMMRRRLEDLAIGERLEIQGASVDRPKNLHYHIRLASGTHVDVRARIPSVHLLDEILMIAQYGVDNVRG